MKAVIRLGLISICALLVFSCSRSPRNYIQTGNAQYSAGRLEDAALSYRKAIQKDPRSGEAMYRLGLVRIKQDNIAEAYRSLVAAVPLLPGNEAVRVKLGDI